MLLCLFLLPVVDNIIYCDFTFGIFEHKFLGLGSLGYILKGKVLACVRRGLKI
jgi:hypothetical protein